MPVHFLACRWGLFILSVVLFLPQSVLAQAEVSKPRTNLVWQRTLPAMQVPLADLLFAWKHDSIQDLRELPVGPVRLEGVVTYADTNENKIFIQDETGAIVVNGSPKTFSIKAGDVVHVEARKTQSYNPLRSLLSLELEDLKITPVRTSPQLPAPAAASPSLFPEKDKNGIRVQLTGLVHYATREKGHIRVVIGGAGQELDAILPDNQVDISHWNNARIRVTGVDDSTFFDNGDRSRRQLWVQNAADYQVEPNGSTSVPLYSIRGLYSDSHSRDGHPVRVRGRVVAQISPSSFLLEDRWATIVCDLDTVTHLAVGTAVEVTGYPINQGLRIELYHISAAPINPQLIREADKDQDVAPLTTIKAVHSLDQARANSALPVRVTGVITYNDPSWHQMFLQDSTGGIYLQYPQDGTEYLAGQEVTVIGLTNPGEFAAVIIAPKFIHHGKGNLPKPIPVTAEAMTSGILDSQFTVVTGVMHPLLPLDNTDHAYFDLYSAFGPIRVVVGPVVLDLNYLRSLDDATVRVRGVCGTLFNNRRQLVGIQILVDSSKNIVALQPAPPDPFQQSGVAIHDLLQFSSQSEFRHRVKVTGSVTTVGDEFFYIQDSSGGLQVRGKTSGVRAGDLVEVAGYAIPGGYSPVMTDAVTRVVQHNVSLAAEEMTPLKAADGRFDSKLVTIDGRLLKVIHSVNAQTLLLKSNGYTFNAQLSLHSLDERAPALEEGSVLHLTGICAVQPTGGLRFTKDAVDFRLVIRSPQDIQVLHAAPWWTVQRTLALSTAAVVITFTWIIFLRRRVARQTAALRRAADKQEATQGLIKAMQDVTGNKRFTSRVPVHGGDEIALLSVEFNQMLAELQQRDTEKAEAESKLQQQATTDELTGLPNRRLLSDRLSQVLEMAKRDSRTLALLYLDLDGFKLVNDSLGHTVGDILLGQVSERLKSRIRRSDTLARLGGDEFTVILARLNSKDEAAQVAHNLLEVLAAPFLIEGHEITISASIGISVFPDNGADTTELLQQADSAMYAAKRNGKNRVMYFTPELGSSVRERLNLENQLRGALLRREIEVYYQPEFDVSTRRLVRFEALARWQHPTLGSVPPNKFIPIAEESGLIVPLGAFVLERACQEALTWQSMSDYPIQVAVNVSTIQFRRETFVEEIEQALRHTGLDPKLLQIELTESVMLDGMERASNTMKRLRAMGVSIAVDDFGTGYSCFSYLPRLPFNVLKIDRSFVRELGKRSEMKAMIQALVSLAHDLNMQVVVEGIETSQQLEMVEALGGNQVQGFLLGRPTPNPKSLLAPASTLIPPTGDHSVLVLLNKTNS